jgi:glycolate oxidase
MQMPEPNQALIAGKARHVAALRALVPGEGVIDDDAALGAYECDAFTAYTQRPLAVVLPSTTAQVRAVGAEGRAARGRHLAVGRLPAAGRRRRARLRQVQPRARDRLRQPLRAGAAGRHQSRHHPCGRAGSGFYYAPDPSSQIACSIGGNVAENSGGVHCLKYGLTTNNLLGVEMVLMTARSCASAASISIRRARPARRGHRLRRLLGVVTEVTVRILPLPETAARAADRLPDHRGGGHCVAASSAPGIIPGGMEMMDRPAIHAAEAFVKAGYPLDVEALLIVELDGPRPRSTT